MAVIATQDGLHDRLAVATEGRTYKHLSDLTGTHAESVRRYMQGQPPTVEFLSALCEGLGINGDWLLLGRGPMRREDVKIAALRSADPGELLTAMSGTMERLVERVDRIEVFVQTLETRLRATSRRPRSAASTPSTEGDRPTEQTNAHGQSTEPKDRDDQPDGDQPEVGEPRIEVKASRIGRAVAKRPRPDAQ